MFKKIRNWGMNNEVPSCEFFSNMLYVHCAILGYIPFGSVERVYICKVHSTIHTLHLIGYEWLNETLQMYTSNNICGSVALLTIGCKILEFKYIYEFNNIFKQLDNYL